MYTTISKTQEGSTYKDSQEKCFTTTNSTPKLYRGAMNRGEVLRACFHHFFAAFSLKFQHIDQTHILLK